MAIEEYIANSLSEFIAHIEIIRDRHKVDLWFRGQSQKSFKLVPTLFRHPTKKSIADTLKLEQDLIAEFQFRSPSFTHMRALDDWDLLFLMQHYRVPTRLLDWTASPFSALFFALHGEYGRSDPVVWVLDPKEWNRGMLADITGPEIIYPTTDSLLDQYHPIKNKAHGRATPLAIHGVVNNIRLNAQKGKFVVFGHKLAPQDEFINECDTWNRTPLYKIVIPKSHAQAVKESITDFGITHTAVYPDLEGLAMELRFKNGFN